MDVNWRDSALPGVAFLIFYIKQPTVCGFAAKAGLPQIKILLSNTSLTFLELGGNGSVDGLITSNCL